MNLIHWLIVSFFVYHACSETDFRQSHQNRYIIIANFQKKEEKIESFNQTIRFPACFYNQMKLNAPFPKAGIPSMMGDIGGGNGGLSGPGGPGGINPTQQAQLSEALSSMSDAELL